MFFHPFDSGPIQPLGPGPLPQKKAAKGPRQEGPGASFDSLLKKEVGRTGSGPLVLSAHARERLAGRGISFSESDLARLAGAVDQAAGKGSRDTLLVFHNVGLVVNVPNRTVTTVLDSARMQSGIVTGIDSTVFVENIRES